MQVYIRYPHDDKPAYAKASSLAAAFALGTRAELPLQRAIVFDILDGSYEKLEKGIQDANASEMLLTLGQPV